MHAMILKAIAALTDNSSPLEFSEQPDPVPNRGEVLVRIRVCGVCHTELDEIEGRTPPPKLPVIPGHQAVGTIEAIGDGVENVAIGSRVGVAWVFSTCGQCKFCQRGEENLCPDFQATGRDRNGGYAELMTVPASFVHPIPDLLSDSQTAPLLCAGAVGYRALRLANLQNNQSLGLTGFGASGHLVLQMVRHRYPDSEIYVFARKKEERDFALALGAAWAGDTMETPPKPLHAIIDTTPAWTPIVGALQNLEPGGRLVINAIRKEASDKDALLGLEYQHLWMEKEIKTVANVSRADVRELLRLATEIPLRPEIQEYALEHANQALVDIKNKYNRGAKVLRIS